MIAKNIIPFKSIVSNVLCFDTKKLLIFDNSKYFYTFNHSSSGFFDTIRRSSLS